MLYKVFNNIYKKIALLSILLLMFSFPVYAEPEPVMDGHIPSWINTGTNNLVMRMRFLAGKIPAYFDRIGGTTCCYTVSVALRGTPYGADPKVAGVDTSRSYEGDLVGCDQIAVIAMKKNEWHDASSGYKPKPGDLVINTTSAHEFGHVTMCTESLGTISNGNTDRGGVTEYKIHPTNLNHNIRGFVETSKYSDGLGFWDNAIDWGLDMLATIADGLNKMVEDFALYATEAMNAISSIGVGIILSLIIIDFTTYLFFNGFEWQLAQLISKIMKYTFLLFIFMNWTWIVNNIFLDFAQSIASAMANGGNVTSNLTQPQFLLRKGVEAVSPCLNFISTAQGLTNPKNWPILLFLVLITFITIAFLMFSAFYVAYVYIEFYLMAAFNALFMIFPTLRFTKFIAEGGISGLITNTIRLFTTAWLVYLIAELSDNATYELDFPADISGLGDGTLYNYIFLCIHIIVLVIVIIKVPDKIARIYGGSINLPN